MPNATNVYLEIGTKRVFAGATEWPGWTRSGRNEEAALRALIDHGPRYATALGAAAGLPLRKGPRGGGRELDAIIRHVAEAETSYFYRLGGKYPKGEGADVAADVKRLRAQILDLITRRVQGESIPLGKRTAPLWTPRYFVRRTAWHALDHAWEIEDRAIRDDGKRRRGG